MYLVAVAQGARQPQVFGIIHGHAARTLDQRFDDEGGNFGMVFSQMALKYSGGAACYIGGCFTRLGPACIGRWYGSGSAHQRCVGIPENGHVGDCQRADRFAVVAAFEAKKLCLAFASSVAPAVKGHFQGDLGGRGAVRGVKTMAQSVAGQRR